ncbi:MAG: hypothetical protein JXR69_00940 [Candidatus Delongbacteria bacterium]|nr:hypothetical protein [Candidatus Delongbacteria bacterium]
MCIINTPRYFKQKDKVRFLFLASGLKRSIFESQILKVVTFRYLSRFVKTIPTAILIILGNNLIFDPVNIFPLIFLGVTIPTINLVVIYLSWKSIIKNKDYDTIKRAKVMQT